MSKIEIDESSKKEIVSKLQKYFREELNEELGGFDAEFLLDFFSNNVGAYYYNQGLVDALGSFQTKLEECTDIIYQLEQVVE